jgi:glutathione S-transferase
MQMRLALVSLSRIHEVQLTCGRAFTTTTVSGSYFKTPSIRRHRLQQTYYTTMTDSGKQQTEEKTYHKKATGQAQLTVKKHSKECDLKLFASCFWYLPPPLPRLPLFILQALTSIFQSPFVQRVWIALEVKGIPYQYIEVDPYKKPDELLEVNPRGLVPALRHGHWGCYESNVLLEYVGFPFLCGLL